MKRNGYTLTEVSLCLLAAVSLAVFISLVFWITPAFFESHTFNKLTGSKTTAWDALWVELRVIEPHKGE